MELGDKLKTLRKNKGLSLKQLSKKVLDISEEEMKVSISFLSDIENGRSKPSLAKLKFISAALETPVSYFVDNSEVSLFSGAIEDVEFIPVIELLKDFNNWSIEDKKELIYYLKAKKILRTNK